MKLTSFWTPNEFPSSSTIQENKTSPWSYLLLTGISLSLFLSFYLLSYPGVLFGGDNMTQMMVLEMLQKHLKELDFNIWYPQLECGVPGWIYYQPLGHFISAFIGIFIPLGAIAYYKLLVTVLIALLPWIFFFSLRHMGFSLKAALIAAALFAGQNCFLPFGLHIAAIYKKGTFPFLWSICFALPTIGCFFKAFHAVNGKQGKIFPAGVWLGLTFLAHPLAGLICSVFGLICFLTSLWNNEKKPPSQNKKLLILLALGGIFSLIFTLCQEIQNNWKWGYLSGVTSFFTLLLLTWRQNPNKSLWKKNAFKLVAIYVLANIVMLPFSLPLVLNADNYGGFPMKDKLLLWGFPVEKLGLWFLKGEVLDYRLPIAPLTCAFFGFLLCFPKFRKNPLWQTILIFFLFSMIFTMGYTSFGGLIYLNPANFGVPHFRYMAGVQLSCLMAASLFIAFLLEHCKKQFFSFLTLLFFVAIPFLNTSILRLNPKEVEVHGYYLKYHPIAQHKASSFEGLKTYLNQQKVRGRVHNLFTADRVLSYYSNIYTKHPMARSWGNGGQEGLSTFYLDCDTYLWARPEILELFAIDFIVGGFKTQWTGKRFDAKKFLSEKWTPIDFGQGVIKPEALKENDVALYRYKGPVQLFSFVEIGALFIGPSKSARPLLFNWMKSDWLKKKSHLLRVATAEEIPVEFKSYPQVISQTKKDWELVLATDYQFKQAPPNADWNFQWPPQNTLSSSLGKVEKIQGERNRFSATLQVNKPAWVMFKMSHHPYWQASFNGDPLKIYQISPSFMGVKVPKGEGELLFQYLYPTWAKLLWGSFFLFLFVCCIWRIKSLFAKQ